MSNYMVAEILLFYENAQNLDIKGIVESVLAKFDWKIDGYNLYGIRANITLIVQTSAIWN